MSIYVLTAINDPTDTETAYIIGAYSTEEAAHAQIITWMGCRNVKPIDYSRESWGERYYFYDETEDSNFHLDIEKVELDAQYFFLR